MWLVSQEKRYLKLITKSLLIFCALPENNADGATFLNFTQDELKDIFPTNFIFRKKIWDYLEDYVHAKKPTES